MDSTQQMEALIKSHREIQKSNLIEWNSLQGVPTLAAHPFDEEELLGDFICNTNKSSKRYSPLYTALNDQGFIFNNCKMDIGYSTLLVCEKLGTTTGQKPISFKEFGQFGEGGGTLEGKFCVFQNPFTKLFHHSHFDMLMVGQTLNEANEFATNFTASENISTLIARIKFQIYWH